MHEVSRDLGAIVATIAKNHSSKNHPKGILHDQNYKILVHLASSIVFTTRKHSQEAGY